MKSGFSLLELTVAMAIGSIGCLALMQMSTAQMRVDKKVKERIDLVELRASIHARIDCEMTVEAVCRRALKKLISSKGSMSRSFRPNQRHIALTPKCINGNVFVDYSYQRNDLPDPDLVTGRIVEPRPLFPGPLCVTRRYAPPTQCQTDQATIGYDFDTKRYVCARR